MGPSEPRITPCEATYPPLIAKRRRQVRKLDVMMVPVDDDDDFIVQPPGEGEDDSKNGVQAGPGASLLEGFKRLVFAKGQPEDAENKEPDPTLPPGFSAILNAEEEEIYPANSKIRVVVAEGALGGRARRQAAELHQALQQVVGAAAIYRHLIRKHKGVGTGRRRKMSDAGSEPSTAGAEERCGCGGNEGPCKAISNLLREELAKVTDAAEAERRGALLKKLRQAERRSGGLCNPAQLQREASTSSINSSEHLSDAMGSPTAVAPVVDSPSRGLSSWGTGMSALASAAAAGAPVVSGTSGFLGNHALSGGGGSLVGSPTESLKRQADVPWADNMLSAANRTRYGAMLKKRGRDLAKRMSVIMPAAAAEVQAVAVRLPPLEDDVEGEAAPIQQLSLHGNNKTSHVNGPNPSGNRSRSLSGSGPLASSPASSPGSTSSNGEVHPSPRTSLLTGIMWSGSSSRPARPRAQSAPDENDAKFSQPKALFGTNDNARRGSRLGPSLGSDGGEVVIVDPRKKRQDWKLSAQELSMMNKEEESIMPPEVLGKLLSAGVSIPNDQQSDFWDIFSRLEVATRTEALLNVAIRGGKGCPARAGRVGRELCMSLTSVVLDAIAAVEKNRRLMVPVHATASGAQTQSQQSQQRQQTGEHKQQNRPSHSSLKKEEGRALQEQLRNARNCRSGEIHGSRPHLPPRKEEANSRLGSRARASPVKQGVHPRAGLREDPGLSDLDQREGEFRQAIYVVRSDLTGRLLKLTNDAPLCAEVLGNFVNVIPPDTARTGGAGVEDTDDDGLNHKAANAAAPRESPPKSNGSSRDESFSGGSLSNGSSSNESLSNGAPVPVSPVDRKPTLIEESTPVASSSAACEVESPATSAHPLPPSKEMTESVHHREKSDVSWHARGPSKDEEDTLLFECNDSRTEGSQPATPSLASTTPMSDAGDKSSARTASRDSSDVSACAEDELATKMARSGVDSTSEGPGTLGHSEPAIDRESIGSSTAPNSPPA